MKNAYFSPGRGCRPALHTPGRSRWSGLVPCHVAYTWKKQSEGGPRDTPVRRSRAEGPPCGPGSPRGGPAGREASRRGGVLVLVVVVVLVLLRAPPRRPGHLPLPLGRGLLLHLGDEQARQLALHRAPPPHRPAAPRRAAPTAAAGPAAKCARAALPPHPSLLAVSHGKCSPGCRGFSPSVWGDAEARAAAAVGGTAAAAAARPGFGTWCGPRGADTSCLPSPPPDVCCFVCLFFLLPKERQIAYTSGVASALA